MLDDIGFLRPPGDGKVALQGCGLVLQSRMRPNCERSSGPHSRSPKELPGVRVRPTLLRTSDPETAGDAVSLTTSVSLFTLLCAPASAFTECARSLIDLNSA